MNYFKKFRFLIVFGVLFFSAYIYSQAVPPHLYLGFDNSAGATFPYVTNSDVSALQYYGPGVKNITQDSAEFGGWSSVSLGNQWPWASGSSVFFEYGVTSAYGAIASATPYIASTPAAVDILSGLVSGLSCGTVYHYRVVGYSGFSGNYYYSTDGTFSTLPCNQSSVVSTLDLGYLNSTSARLQGKLTSFGTLESPNTTTLAFDYGTLPVFPSDPLYSHSVIAGTGIPGGNLPENFGAKVELLCGTTYHYRAKAVSSFYPNTPTAYGIEKQFTTPTCTSSPAVATTEGISLLTGFKMKGTITFEPSPLTDLGFEYGTSSSLYTNIVQLSPTSLPVEKTFFSNRIVPCDKVYYYRAFAKTAYGVAYGIEKKIVSCQNGVNDNSDNSGGGTK